MYKQKILLTIILFTILLTSCSGPSQQDIKESSQITWDDLQIAARDKNNLCKELKIEEDEWERSKNDFTYGLFGEISPKDSSSPNRLADRTAWINANEQQLLSWRFWYPEGNDQPVNLRLFVLLDEHQLNNALPSPGMYNDINLERGDDVALTVTIPPLNAGIHDIVAIGIPYPEEYPNEYGIVNLVYWRITLIAEPLDSPFRKLDFVSLPAEGSIKRNDPSMALELTLKNNGIDVWNWPDPWLAKKANSLIQFYALVGHEDITNLDAPPMDELAESFFSLLLFVDYQQVEVSPNQMALYGRVDKDTAYARIPLEIPPLPEGKHHILVLSIDTPGVPICILRGDHKGRILPNSVYGKLVGINVVPSE